MSKNFNEIIHIIGGGFSGSIAKIYLNKKSKLIAFNNKTILNKTSLIRRKNIECNKFFGKKSNSIGSLNISLNNAIFHDRLIFSGNSSVWGGKIDLSNFSITDLNFFKKKKILFKKLSFRNTGTVSNNKNIHQIQSLNNKILKTDDLSLKFTDGYLLSFFCRKKIIYLKIKFKNQIKIISTKKVILCLGSIQLLDLLFRSKYIKKGDIIQFSEYKHNFKLRTIFSNFEKKATVVRYHISRAIGHYFGIQFYSKLLKFFKFIPLCIDQNFYYKKNRLSLKLNDNKFTQISKRFTKKNKFGVSIHYCNLKINNIEINKFLRKIHPSIFGLGMSFIDQTKPGPISNEIILDAKFKCNKLIKLKS